MSLLVQKGNRGIHVEGWQNFLLSEGFEQIVVDGIFGRQTDKFTRVWQRAQGLKADGIVGPNTLRVAKVMGLDRTYPNTEAGAADWNDIANKPPSGLMMSKPRRWGEDRPHVGLFGRLVVPRSFRKRLVKVEIPQLSGIASRTTWLFHPLMVDPVRSTFDEWEKAGLMRYVLTWHGSYVPRMVRGSKTKPSDHAYGTAFDINARWNRMGRHPATVDEVGTVVPLLEIASKNGLYWGGWWTRPDGMHFELGEWR